MDLACVSQSLGIIHPICIERGRNAEVWDQQGTRYIDFIGGIGVLNLGHGHPEIVNAVINQATRLIHSAFNAVPHQGYMDVCRQLADFVPVTYSLTCMLTNSGAEATENALKIARAATGRQAVIAFDDGFHGRTLAALSLNGKVKPYKIGLGALPGPVYHLPFPSPDSDVDADQALLALERLFEVEISSEDVACIIVEPVQGEGGFRRLCPQFAQRLQSICKDLGILLIIDEIQSGFGRTGHRFAFSQLNIEPDLLLIGKSIAAGLPLAAVVGRPELMNALTKGGLGGTYSGNALACAAASQVMKLMTEDQLRTWGVQQEGMILDFHAALKATHLYPMLGPLTGIGCMRGIVFESTPDATGAEHLAKLLVFAREEGVLLMPSGRHKNILRLLPPLTTEAEILQEGLACIERALRKL